MSSTKQLGDGFGHMVEKEEDDEPVQANADDTNILESQKVRITELEAQLSDQNELRQHLTETKARLEVLKMRKWLKLVYYLKTSLSTMIQLMKSKL